MCVVLCFALLPVTNPQHLQLLPIRLSDQHFESSRNSAVSFWGTRCLVLPLDTRFPLSPGNPPDNKSKRHLAIYPITPSPRSFRCLLPPRQAATVRTSRPALKQQASPLVLHPTATQLPTPRSCVSNPLYDSALDQLWYSVFSQAFTPTITVDEGTVSLSFPLPLEDTVPRAGRITPPYLDPLASSSYLDRHFHIPCMTTRRKPPPH
jgi:hypothetical protein